jgi:hypothetical protein
MSNTLISLFLVATLGALATAASPAPGQKGPVDTGPGTLAAARKYLEGRWGLLSLEIFPPGAPPLNVKGEGMLTYDGFGNLDVQIRVDQATNDVLRAAGIPTMDGSLSSSGRTVVDMKARTLTYIFKGQPPRGAPSGPLALNRPRHWEVNGNVLTLTTKGDDGKPVSVARWQKAP